jgi:hypothetical protein
LALAYGIIGLMGDIDSRRDDRDRDRDRSRSRDRRPRDDDRDRRVSSFAVDQE